MYDQSFGSEANFTSGQVQAVGLDPGNRLDRAGCQVRIVNNNNNRSCVKPEWLGVHLQAGK